MGNILYRVLIADDDEFVVKRIRRALGADFATDEADTAGETVDKVRRSLAARPYDLLLLDIRFPDDATLAPLKKIHAAAPALPVIMLSSVTDTETIVDAIKLGAVDYVAKPFREIDIVNRVMRAIEETHQKKKAEFYRQAYFEEAGGVELVFASAAMAELDERLKRIARTDAAVLITGETGTGKEVLARRIHALHPARSEERFMPVNLAALPSGLCESELFGHKKGAFTGAVENRKGAFLVSNGGTLFLDEIGEMPLTLQPKLLRAIETAKISPLGSDDEIDVNTRIVAATHRDLKQLVREGAFREDLLFRIEVASLTIPPLRERKEDIGPLAEHFVRKFNARMNAGVGPPSAKIVRLLGNYDWPGNVRELQNVIEQAMIFAEGGELKADEIAARLERGVPVERENPGDIEVLETLRALKATGWRKAEAAKILGVHPNTITNRINRYDLESLR